MTELEAIAKAGEIYADPARRLRGGFAGNFSGELCEPNDPRAVRWDALGAIFAAYNIGTTVPEDYTRSILRIFSAAMMISTQKYKASLPVLCDQGREEEALDVLRRTWMWAKHNPPPDDDDADYSVSHEMMSRGQPRGKSRMGKKPRKKRP